MRTMKRVLSLALVLVLLTALGVTVFASDIKKEYDATIPNSIDLHMTAGGGSLKIYKVADRVSGTAIEPTAEFTGSTLPTDMNDVAADAVALAAALLDYAEANGASATVKDVDENGDVSFTGLAAGLYLIASDEAPLGYCKITPFLIDLPHFTDLQWDYYPSAEPKMVAAGKINPPLEKIIQPTGHGANDPFTFTMTPTDKNAPMPDPALYTDGTASLNSSTGAMSITKKGPGVTEFGWMYFDDDDVGKTYVYTIAESIGSLPGYTYDRTSYVMTVEVSRDPTDNTIILDVTTKTGTGNTANSIVFTNKWEDKKVPKTGQLWWPVAVMGLGGVALIGVGAIMRKKRETDR